MESLKSVIHLRREYKLSKLSEETVHKNPFAQFQKWFKDVLKAGITEPNAMILATSDSMANPSVRVVLLKRLSNKGFTFFTSYNSRKGKQISDVHSASILFFWSELERQVRIEGKLHKITESESRKYFNTRPVGSRIAAWASEQSSIIPDREFLETRFQIFKMQFKGKRIPMPPHWGGYILIPDYFEFWQGRENRLHDRICYRKSKRGWDIFRLAP